MNLKWWKSLFDKQQTLEDKIKVFDRFVFQHEKLVDYNSFCERHEFGCDMADYIRNQTQNKENLS